MKTIPITDMKIGRNYEAHYRRQKIEQVVRLVVGAFVIGSFPFFYMVACWLDQI